MGVAGRLAGWLGRRRGQRAREEAGASRNVYEVLAAFRFVSVATVVALTGAVGQRESVQASTTVVATLAAAYSIVVVVLGARLAAWPRASHIVLGLDSALGLAGVLLGGGVDSPFLLYALVPVLSAAILLGRVFAVALASLAGGTVTLAHTAGSLYFGAFPWIMEGNYLTLVPVYVLVCLGAALLPFYANLNLRRQEQLAARRAEQRRLRAELHDNLAQSLSALTLGLRQLRRMAGAPQQLAEMVEISERSYGELREMLDVLEAGVWEPTPVDSLAHMLEAWEEETGIEVIAAFPDGQLDLPSEVAVALLGIARESLANVGKHSGATQVWVELQSNRDGTLLSVWDNGCGFSSDRPPGHGRRIMQERAESIGATLEVTSAPGEGTGVQVRCPRRR